MIEGEAGKPFAAAEINAMICIVTDREEKQRIVRTILEALPEWFSIPEAREHYIAESVGQVVIAAREKERPVGFLCLKETGKDTVELAVMGVLKEYHRCGLGRRMLEEAVAAAKERGYSFLQVKTVQMGRYEEYDRTNRFFLSVGFKEFEVFPTLWDAANPCQIYVMAISGPGRARGGKREQAAAFSTDTSGAGGNAGRRMMLHEDWIRERLPKSLPEEAIRRGLALGGYYREGLKVMSFGERGGPDRLEYEAADEEDLRLWELDKVCSRIAAETELLNRKKNAAKWRYSRDHAENGFWFYAERRSYVYNAVEDTRLASFELYLALIQPSFPRERWEKAVQQRVELMNRWYAVPHWDYDKSALRFVEISDSKEHSGGTPDTEEPRPGSVVKTIDG